MWNTKDVVEYIIVPYKFALIYKTTHVIEYICSSHGQLISVS